MMRLPLLISMCAVSVGLSAQIYPEYRVPSPSMVAVNHSCVNNSEFHFTEIISDPEGSIYARGFADVDLDNNPIYFGSNTGSPLSFVRPASHSYFITKFTSDGMPVWTNFFSQEPLKCQSDPADNLIYVHFASSNYLQINGIAMPADSTPSHDDVFIASFKMDDGTFYGYLNNKYLKDLFIAGDRKFITTIRNFTTSYSESHYGFLRGNQIVKWQSKVADVDQMPLNLQYNPYENMWWYIAGLNYYKLYLHPSIDSLIAENKAREIYKEKIPPYNSLSTVKKFMFTRDGYVAMIAGSMDHPYYNNYVVKIDTAGNLKWKILLRNALLALDPQGDLWIDFNTPEYSHKVKIEPQNQEYFLVSHGNTALINTYLWRMDGESGGLKAPYINGYGLQHGTTRAIHITSKNRLFTTPRIYSLAFYPDSNGVFIPYYARCSNVSPPSQALLVGHNLNEDLKLFKFDPKAENMPGVESDSKGLAVYPNPSGGTIYIRNAQTDDFYLYDAKGSLIAAYKLTSGEHQISMGALSPGVYLLRNLHGQQVKIIRE